MPKRLPSTPLIHFREGPVAHIDIKKAHALTPADARARVEDIAKHFSEKFQIDTRWNRDTLEFSRTGVKGSIAVRHEEIHVAAELGFFLGWLKPVIEKEIDSHFDQHFS